MMLGIVLVLTGVVWLLVNYSVISAGIWTVYWPLLLVYLGIIFLMDDNAGTCYFCRTSRSTEKNRPVVKNEVAVKTPVTKKTVGAKVRKVKKTARK